jgi:hypothetical protein
MGILGPDWGWGTYLLSKGVVWDVTGTHIYQGFSSPSLLTDTYYGTGGPFPNAASFGKPITINEFNAHEIYDSDYGNADGNAKTEQGYQALYNHMSEIRQATQNIESVVCYELLDEPAKGAPENRFGLMFNLSSPKVALYIWTYFAGGQLSSAEKAELVSRGLMASGQPFGSRIQSYAAGVIRPNDTNANFDNFIKSQYLYWKGAILKTTASPIGNIPAGAYWPQFSDTTASAVSEGMGYAMLITAVMSGYDAAAQTIFDGLYKFVKAFPCSGTGSYGATVNPTAGANLMSWRIGADGLDQGGGWPALDGDLDIGLALLMADRQWGSTGTYNYASEAAARISAMKALAFAAIRATAR